MKMKRVFADDMRSAMRQVRESHGANAVIISSRRVEGGVEVISAVDYDEQAVRDAAARDAAAGSGDAPAPPDAGSGETGGFERLLARADSAASRQAPTTHSTGFSVTVGDDAGQPPVRDEKPTDARPSDGESSIASSATQRAEETVKPSARPPAAATTEARQEPAMQAMHKELSTLRSLFENQLTLMEWRETSKTTPTRATLMRRLHGMGFGPDVCRGVADAVSAWRDPDQALREALARVSRRVATTDEEIIDPGGVVAVIGPTGVGKTTTVAKLAARFVMRHGRGQVALVTTDNYRIGGQEQLRNFARILGVPVHAAGDGDELGELLDDFADRRLVLVDTAGMSQRDMRLAEQMRTLNNGAHRIRPCLVLSATTQLATLMETLRAFRAAAPEACIVSKADEAASLGGVLTAVMRGRLPIAYVADGQRVPEDLRSASAAALVAKAESLTAGQQAEDDESLAVAFAGSATR